MRYLLKGIVASEGNVRGTVKIIKDVTDEPNIAEGSIIVTPYTTPLMSLVLSKAKALITDFGGITSHGAVIAREFGIPCIVATNNATKFLKDGQEIFFNGKTGEIYEI